MSWQKLCWASWRLEFRLVTDCASWAATDSGLFLLQCQIGGLMEEGSTSYSLLPIKQTKRIPALFNGRTSSTCNRAPVKTHTERQHRYCVVFRFTLEYTWSAELYFGSRVVLFYVWSWTPGVGRTLLYRQQQNCAFFLFSVGKREEIYASDLVKFVFVLLSIEVGESGTFQLFIYLVSLLNYIPAFALCCQLEATDVASCHSREQPSLPLFWPWLGLGNKGLRLRSGIDFLKTNFWLY